MADVTTTSSKSEEKDLAGMEPRGFPLGSILESGSQKQLSPLDEELDLLEGKGPLKHLKDSYLANLPPLPLIHRKSLVLDRT